MFGLGAGELFVILVFALLFIGPKKLPELAKGLGKGLREFQKAKDELMNEVHNPSLSEEEKNKIAQAQHTESPAAVNKTDSHSEEEKNA